MKKVFITVLCLLTVISLLGFSQSNVYAEDEEYKSFLQNDERWANYVYGSSDTLKKSGCAITSLAILQAYADPSLRDVNVWNPEICAKNYDYAGNGLKWNSKTDNWKVVNHDKSYAFNTEEDLITAMKKHRDAGQYIILQGRPMHANGSQSSGHFCPVVGWDETNDKPIVWDVAYGWAGGKSYEYFIEGGAPYRLVICESTLNSSTETIFNPTNNLNMSTKSGANGGEAESLTTTQLAGIVAMESEWELKGMPILSDMDATYLEFANQSDLSISEINTMYTIKDGVDQSRTTVEKLLNSAAAGLGIGLTSYSILLTAGYIFDKVNNLFDLSLVSFLTLGKMQVAGTANSLFAGDQGERKLLSKSGFFFRIGVLVLVGLLLASGAISKFVYLIVKVVAGGEIKWV